MLKSTSKTITEVKTPPVRYQNRLPSSPHVFPAESSALFVSVKRTGSVIFPVRLMTLASVIDNCSNYIIASAKLLRALVKLTAAASADVEHFR